MGRGHTFSNQMIREEMLDFRRKGYSYIDIARKYNSDHTTILYHCRRAGLVLNEELKNELYSLVKKGFSAIDVGKKLNIPSTVVDFYCFRYGVRGKKLTCRTKLHLDPISIKPKRIKREKIIIIKHQSQLLKIDEKGTEWLIESSGELVCLGKSKKQEKIDEGNKKKKELELKRLEILTY
jgi:hypothetical protein